MKTSSKILIALGAGLIIGGITGVLFAPDKGSETRRKISDTGKKLADKINCQVKKSKQVKEDVLSRINGEMEEAL
jgi:gas vesicle protein